MSIGGPIIGVSINGRNFSVAADADTTRKLGGFSRAVEMNGDGSARVIMTRTSWSVGGLNLDINDARGDQEYLSDVQAGKYADVDGYVPIAVEYASSSVYSGRGTITDEVEFGSQNATAGVSLAGPGKLIKQ